jgi:hypothetical protein
MYNVFQCTDLANLLLAAQARTLYALATADSL